VIALVKVFTNLVGLSQPNPNSAAMGAKYCFEHPIKEPKQISIPFNYLDQHFNCFCIISLQDEDIDKEENYE
jgi:hypothetical protein|tara:strand:- start:1297 stop:1512 length:216 start_codon:yes stop_codon:yes gene_type:complete